MEKDTTFIYSYSAKENKEVQEIRRKYLPQDESSLEELKRLDNKVSQSGVTEALCTGIGGMLIFGFGMCLSMHVIGSGTLFTVLGVIIGIVGIIGMGAAYPVYRRLFKKTKEELTPRILELTEELAGKEK